ncbi:MAG TPA: acyl-CoA dehydrogenase family protein [Blastocatellia bacterium]|nr:acyl-CoA dehydrogenase family protein [Blastocatellia bacterium]
MYFQDEPKHIAMLRENMRRFVARELPREKVRAWDQQCHTPLEVFRKLAETGVCGLTIAEEYGGVGQDIVAAVAVIEELAKRGGAAAGPFIHCAFYGGMNISENGNEAQKRELLPKLARGELLMAYGLSEPDVGGDLASVTTTARKSDEGQTVIINGTKRWCTGTHFADYIICLVKSDANAPRYRNLSLILVPINSPGIFITDLNHLGLRYTPSTDVTFTNVEVPIANVLGGAEQWNEGWRLLAGRALDVEKIEITAVAVGIAAAAVEEAWEYSQTRVQFDKPICAHQAVRHKLVEARTKLQACRHMLYHAAWLANEGKPCAVETSMAKLFVGDTVVEIALACQQVMGAYGCTSDYDMERHVRDLLLMPIVGGSSNMQKNNIAARLGLPQ